MIFQQTYNLDVPGPRFIDWAEWLEAVIPAPAGSIAGRCRLLGWPSVLFAVVAAARWGLKLGGGLAQFVERGLRGSRSGRTLDMPAASTHDRGRSHQRHRAQVECSRLSTGGSDVRGNASHRPS